MWRVGAYLLGLSVAPFAMAEALSLQQCARYVHWHAVEAGHRDLGEARVAWAEVWSAEGVAADVTFLDCGTGEGLRTRARSERMSEDLPYDRRDRVRAVIDETARYPHFFSWDVLEARLSDLHVPVTRVTMRSEPCACAARYPDQRGDKAAFEFETAAWALEIGPDGKARKRAEH